MAKALKLYFLLGSSRKKVDPLLVLNVVVVSGEGAIVIPRQMVSFRVAKFRLKNTFIALSSQPKRFPYEAAELGSCSIWCRPCNELVETV